MRLTERVHQQFSEKIRPGDFVIDATAGNGHDTLALARTVLPGGTVVAIDRQVTAIEATRKRLLDAGLDEAVDLVCADHADYLKTLCATRRSEAAAIVFNLGYLPGGDHRITSTAESTLQALEAALELLRADGALYVTAYPGHPEGATEATAVQDWMQAQTAKGHAVECHRPEAKRPPPELWILQRSD